jgi:RNA polymerase sigma-70 factor (sigma-E family)
MEESSAVKPDFAAWVEAREPALLRFAYLVLRDGDAAREAVQDALTSACAKWSRISVADDPDAYVRRMVVNAHTSRWRRSAKREVLVAEVKVPGHVDESRLPEQEAVWQLCATLPTQQRAAVVLRFYEDLSYAEIAQILHCTEPTARSHVHRALAKLREQLDGTESP